MQFAVPTRNYAVRWTLILAGLLLLAASCREAEDKGSGAKLVNTMLLADIINPQAATYLEAASYITQQLAKAESLCASMNQSLDPRLRDLAVLGQELMTEWSNYGRTPDEARNNPDVPIDLLERGLELNVKARDLAAEFAPQWVASANGTIESMRERIRERKANP